MVRFGVLSATFWSIGVDLVAGAVFLGCQSNLKSFDPGTHGLEGEFLDENSGPHGFVELLL